MKGSWIDISMNEACDLITCGVAARPNYVDEGIPFLSAKNVKNGEIVYSDYNCITLENHRELTKKNKPLPGDILYTRVGSFGEAAVIKKDIEFSVFVSLTLIKPKKDILNPFFLKHYLNSPKIKTLAKKSITSSGVGNLNVGTVRKFPVIIPPLQEQKQIVETLDKAFEKIDKAIANIERNIENAEELFLSKLNQIFTETGQGTEKKALGELGTLTSSKRIFKKEYVDKGVPFYRSKEIKELGNNRSISLELFITNERYEEIKNRFGVPKKGDILITAVGTIGETYVVKEEDKFYFKDGNIMWLKDFEDVDSYYLKYALNNFVEQLKALSRGSAYKALTIEKLKDYSIQVPSFQKQKEVVKDLDILKKKMESLILINRKSLNNLENLKKSILEKAFKGELTSAA